jgi:anti-sigma regulatory factor (Ser/Thr protein kinase)
MAGLVEACGWIEELSSSNGLSDDTANAIQVCFEELASNIVRHSGDGVWSDPPVLANTKSSFLVFKVDLSIEVDRVRLVLEDNGKPFDVVSARSHGVDQPLSDMAVGGLGLHLVKTLANAVHYRRTDLGNEVSLEFSRLPLQEPSKL